MTGMVLVFSRGAIRYKSKFQTVIAHSSTEAKFVAACDTAKLIFFLVTSPELGHGTDISHRSL